MTPIEPHVRSGEVLNLDADLVVRGWPLTVDGLLHNAAVTRRRYSFGGRPLDAVSADVTVELWDLDAILAGPRLRTRRTYARTRAGQLVEVGFGLLATFAVPHYSVILPSYSEETAEQLLRQLGDIRANPHFVRRES